MSYIQSLPDGTLLGEVRGIVEGTAFPSRRELHDSGLHRGLMRGIAPHGSSIVLSGGYEDDEDFGDLIIYTGEGGRDPKTGRQVADQKLTGGNRELAKNRLRGIPIRVHRGSGHNSKFSPTSGYMYAGLFAVLDQWFEEGASGFQICRFRLEKLGSSELQPPTVVISAGTQNPARRQYRVTRVVRESEVSDDVKNLHKHTCQFCSTILETPAGRYAEGCHIRPLGRPHNGPDTPENMLCLCPNCHVLFDQGAIVVEDTFHISGSKERVRMHPDHPLNIEHFRYHRNSHTDRKFASPAHSRSKNR